MFRYTSQIFKLTFQKNDNTFSERKKSLIDMLTAIPFWKATVHFNKEAYLIGFNPIFP